VEKNNELLTKNEDLKKTHDRKTDMVGKLITKNFVIMSGLRYLNEKTRS
jgi:hypothetical protein